MKKQTPTTFKGARSRVLGALLLGGALVTGACSSSSDDDESKTVDAASNAAVADAMPGTAADAKPAAEPDAMASAQSIPNWMLEDLQTNETYGLDTFNGKILIAVLVQGF